MSEKMFDNLRTVGTHYGRVKNDMRALGTWMAAFKARLPHWGPDSLEMAAAEWVFADTWVCSGEIVYSLSHSLAALFALTSAPDIDWCHLPHAAFVIQVPRHFLPLPGTIEPEHSYVYFDGQRRQILLVADYDTTAFSWTSFNEQQRGGASSYFEKLTPQKAIEALHGAYIKRDESRSELIERLRNDPLTSAWPQTDLERVADRILGELETKLSRQKLEASERIDTFSVGIQQLAVRFLANTLAYLNEARPGSVAPASSDAQRRPRILNMLPPRELVVQRAFRDAAKDAVSAIVAGSIVGVRRVLKHHVRGHWRDQAVGPGHSQRRKTWIHPHERGSQDLGAVVRRVETIDIPSPKNN